MSKAVITEAIAFTFVLLFVYTGVSKLLDFSNFRAVIGQSPLITRFAPLLAIAVPLTEIIISVFLVMPKFRLKALCASYGLMVLFTCYIVILVMLSEKLPCSCGGVLQQMSWKQHIYFNVLFILLGFFGMYFQSQLEHGRKKASTQL